MSNGMQVTFRADPDKIDRLDDLLILAKAKGQIDRDVTRSDLLRRCVDDLIEELEDDTGGNFSPAVQPAD